MCSFENGFILCSCKQDDILEVDEDDNYDLEELDEDIYIWKLYEFKGKEKKIFEGIYSFPNSDIGQGLTKELVVQNLNAKNCFDFEYSPKEGDSLEFHRKYNRSEYQTFIFENGKWIFDQHSPFSAILELKFKGKIKKL